MLNQAAHPLAGASMTGADMLVQVLADEGVDTIFGYSGGAILPIYDAVFRYNQEHESAMPLIVPANEQGAGFMAAGYARASGRVGVALVTSGPGATNTVTPVRDSMADSVPIVVICGQVPTTAIGTDAFQEAPVPSIMGAVAKHVFLITDQIGQHGGFRAHRGDLRPGAHHGHRYRCVPRSAGAEHHGRRGEACISDYRSDRTAWRIPCPSW